MGEPLQVAEHDRSPVFLWQESQLLLNERLQIQTIGRVILVEHLAGSALLDLATASRLDPGPRRDAGGDTMQPARDGALFANPTRLAK